MSSKHPARSLHNPPPHSAAAKVVAEETHPGQQGQDEHPAVDELAEDASCASVPAVALRDSWLRLDVAGSSNPGLSGHWSRSWGDRLGCRVRSSICDVSRRSVNTEKRYVSINRHVSKSNIFQAWTL